MGDQPVTATIARNLADIRGHNAFLADFSKSLQSGRMHHAWLLTGPSGIGKASMARLAAAWLLSENAPENALFAADDAPLTLKADDAGANLVLNGAHPDYMAITPAIDGNKSGLIKVDQIREMVPFMMHKPARGGWRVAIIDSMDDVNRSGANAMLKLLEEPPPQAIIFLIAARMGQLPPTIRSRCRVVRMTPLSGDDCRAALLGIWPDADSAHRDLLATLSQGAPGQAIKLAESGAADLYQVVCALLAAPQLDNAALAAVCAKLGRGTAAGRDVRAGAVFCIDRMLRHAAIESAGMPMGALCDFETPVIKMLASRHSAAHLARLYDEFIAEAARAERLFLDFARFLERHLTKIYEKTLP